MLKYLPMSIYWYIDTVLILIAAVTLIISLLLVSRIIKELDSGTLKGKWILLRIMICLFIAGYVAFWFFIPQDTQNDSLIVALVFFFGSIFVVLVSWLMVQTTKDIKRVAKLEVQSITDPLIGIYNRRYLNQRLSEEIPRARRYKFPLSVLLLDIDHFKQVNDRFGHLTGDMVLVKIGEILKQNIRESDIAARYGGEELVLVLPNTSGENAYILAERIRLTLEKVAYKGHQSNTPEFGCTVSIGVASLGDQNIDTEEILRQSDVALYKAKNTGRNRVVIYNPELEEKFPK